MRPLAFLARSTLRALQHGEPALSSASFIDIMRSSATCTLAKLVVQYTCSIRDFGSHAMHLDFADHRPSSLHVCLRQDPTFARTFRDALRSS